MQQAIWWHHLNSVFPLWVVEANHSGTMDPHCHDFWEMVYVRSGRGEHWIDDNAYPIQAGDLYVIAPGEYHRYAPLPNLNVRIVNVLWLPELIEALPVAWQEIGDSQPGREELGYVAPLLRRDLRFAHRLHLPAPTALRVEVLLDEMRREQIAAAPGYDLMLRHLFCALLVLLSRANASERPAGELVEEADRLDGRQVVARAVAYLEERAATPVKVEEVAAHVGLSASRLAHVFKQHTGRSVIAYLHEIRVARAAASLVGTQKSVDAIAAASGFGDSRFFTRVFSRHTGSTPSGYRKRFAQ